MASSLPNLLASLKMGRFQLQNRVAMAPLTRGRATDDNVPTDVMIDYYSQRASAGLIVSEGTGISVQAHGWVTAPDIYRSKDAIAWKSVTDSVHDAGGVMFSQLWHTGRASHSSFRPDREDGRGVAASAVKMEGQIHAPAGKVDSEVPRVLTTEECAALAEEYRVAAACAKEAGFDGVEIHAANGYLLDGFLQSRTNKRTDKYGGSFENRFRVVQEILDAVLTVWSSDSVAIRLSPNGVFNDMGSPDYRESFTYYLQRLSEFKLGYVHVMTGLGFGFHKLGEPFTPKDVRAAYGPGVIMLNCGYTKETAEKDIAAGHCDMVSFGRPYISNPDLVARFAKGAELAPSADMKYWYGGGAEGYSDYPTMS